MTRIRHLLLAPCAALALSAWGAAQAPQYTPELLGPGLVINDMNAHGAVVGWTTVAGGAQAFVARPGGDYELLPLPAGYTAALAHGINDFGVVVGVASANGGRSIAWTPDGAGGYTTQFLGELPGHQHSAAYDINNRGDIVGWSIVPGFQGGPTVWFNAPTGVLDVSALGAASGPKEINDEGVIVGINGGLFDIDTMQATALPGFPAGMSGFQGWAINEASELAGTGIHGSKRSASIWTVAGGWKAISGIVDFSSPVQAFDINAAGVTYAEVPTPAAYFPGIGTIALTSLLAPEHQGNWQFFTNFGGAVNDAGQIAAVGLNNLTGEGGVVLLTPVDDEVGSVYCNPAVANSTGQPAEISAIGSDEVVDNDLTLVAEQLPPNQFGYFLVSATQDFVAGPGGSQGNLCLGGTIGRFVQQIQNSGAGGTFGIPVDLTQLPAPLNVAVQPGETWNFQAWYRDKNPNTTSNFTDGRAVLFQ